MGGISITQLLIIAVIVVLLFGTKTAHAGLRSRRLDQGLQEAIGDDTPSTPTRLRKAARMTLTSRPSLLPISSRK